MKKTLAQRIAVLEAVAPRCSVGGCQVIVKGLCKDHEQQWKEYRKKHFREAHSRFGAYTDQQLFFSWTLSLKEKPTPS